MDFGLIWIKIHIQFLRPLAKSTALIISVLGMLRSFSIIRPKVDQTWAWLHRGHRWAVGVRDPLKSLFTCPCLSVNCYLENQFHIKGDLIMNSSANCLSNNTITPLLSVTY